MTIEELYKTYWQKIFRLCMGYVNDFDSAKDLTQETFIIVWQQLPKFRGESNIATWIFRIATNNCLRYIKLEKRLPKTELPINLRAEIREDMEPEIQLLYRFISELPETDRIVISLELEEIKQSQIASIVGLKETNVRVKIHRAKEKPTQKFKDYGSQ